ncbi:MAG: hypothetical protein QY310_01720 [Candidatus Jettenia sp. CY-1]|nr:MAG: hypothetical protein QY310_01720 [Candidatus Jettenia sp. CY-1]
MRIENNFKGFYLFDGKYTTKRDKKATENQDGGKGMNDTNRAGDHLCGEVTIQRENTNPSYSWITCIIHNS